MEDWEKEWNAKKKNVKRDRQGTIRKVKKALKKEQGSDYFETLYLRKQVETGYGQLSSEGRSNLRKAMREALDDEDDEDNLAISALIEDEMVAYARKQKEKYWDDEKKKQEEEASRKVSSPETLDRIQYLIEEEGYSEKRAVEKALKGE